MTRDILFISLSACAVALTVTLVWFLVELIRIVRGINKTVSTIEEHIARVGGVIDLVREKMHDMSGAVIGLTKVVSGIVSFVAQRRQNKRSKTKTPDDEL